MTLGVEEVHPVLRARSEPKAVHVDRLLPRPVGTADIDDEHVVDVDEDVVISSEGEELGRHGVIDEPPVPLECEMEVPRG